jgi:hypothetical protein
MLFFGGRHFGRISETFLVTLLTVVVIAAWRQRAIDVSKIYGRSTLKIKKLISANARKENVYKISIELDEDL